jgi:hypothetical protein
MPLVFGSLFLLVACTFDPPREATAASVDDDDDDDDDVVDDDPFAVPPQCTSGQTWSSGDRESPLMYPGVACITCHAGRGSGPRFTVAGTVYATGHEPDDCYGGGTAVVVELTDADDETLRLPVNAAGNFFSTASIAFPIRAKVIANGRERVMAATPENGDCNACHSQLGTNEAPGRIVVPR